MQKKFLLIVDGAPLPKAALIRLRRGRFCVALDGAAEQARKEKWTPNLILGDFDSARPKTLSYFGRKGVPLLHTPDQNHTDLEKALRWAIARGATSIWVVQALGSRLDHSLGCLALLSRYHQPEREILLLSGTEKIQFRQDETVRLQGRRGRGFALIPFPRAKVTSHGLSFEMQAMKLALGVRESVSNRAARARVELKIKGRCLVIEER